MAESGERPNLPRELCRYAVQLERQANLVALGGKGLCIGVPDPTFLRELLEDAAVEIIRLRKLVASPVLAKETDDEP